jgi:L-threonylcarbamoyladenylate synthase
MKISCSNTDISLATKVINSGGIVVFPTDTVYGIGCDPYNHEAVRSLYKIKKRKETKPFPIIGYSKNDLEKIAVRVPNNQCVLSLLKECKLLVGTSANISGSNSFTNPDECKNLSGYDLFIDGGVISSKGESTIIEIQEDKIKIVRKGSVSEEEIKELD